MYVFETSRYTEANGHNLGKRQSYTPVGVATCGDSNDGAGRDAVSDVDEDDGGGHGAPPGQQWGRSNEGGGGHVPGALSTGLQDDHSSELRG